MSAAEMRLPFRGRARRIVASRPLAKRALAQPHVFGHGFDDGVVDAAIERLELVDGDVCSRLFGQLSHGLADVPVPVNDLRHGESHLQHVAAVQPRGPPDCPDRVRRRTHESQGLHELLEEQRNAVPQFLFGRLRRHSRGDLRARTRDQVGAVRADELMKHRAHNLRTLPRDGIGDRRARRSICRFRQRAIRILRSGQPKEVIRQCRERAGWRLRHALPTE